MGMVWGRLVKLASLATIACTCGAAVGPADHAKSEYLITWKTQSFPQAHVEAYLSSPDCTFGTSRKWASFFEGDAGWSRFISNLAAQDRSGRALPVHSLAAGRWKIGNSGKQCTVRLSYDIDFSFGRQSWSAGNEQVGYTLDNAVYSTGLPLFVISDDGPAEVSIRVPAGWQFATPWQPVSRSRYRVRNQSELLENTFVVGQNASQSFAAGQFTAQIALLGHPSSSASLFQETFSKLVSRLVNMFGDKREGRYMIVLINGPEDGESFDHSFAVATKYTPTSANQIIWANHLAHELLHYWIGKAIAPTHATRADYKWFTEGFTEYLANRALLDAGIYTQTDFDDRMSSHLGTYLLTRENPFFMKTSLTAAGNQGWHNRPLIYSGGATLAYCLDGYIRQASGNQRNLGTLVQHLFNRSQRGEPLTSAAFVEEASALTGASMDQFYEDYINGTKSLPVKKCAASQGITALVQGYDVFLRN